MTDSTELVVTEQPQQLITIEPTKYAALVFENHRTRADAYKAEAPTVTYDITTTAGMKTAVEWRAKGRDIRVEVTDIHKERKAPILEIGRLMDARKKEIIADVEPDEDRFDRDIKAETARKEAEKQAKLAAEKARVDAIRAKIDEIKDCVVVAMGRSSDEIESAIAELESMAITLEEYGTLAGEAQVAQVQTVGKLKEMLAAQVAYEAEQVRLQAEREQLAREREAESQRLAAERAQLAKERKEAAERERLAAIERQRVEDEQRVAKAKADAAMLAERQAHEARLRAEREAAEAELRKQREAEEARLAEQRAELARQQAAIDAANAERERVERERQEAAEAAARAEARRIADEQAAEARRVQAEMDARQAEHERRVCVEFERVGPGEKKILDVLAEQFEVTREVALNWIVTFDVERINHMEKAA